MLDQSEIKNVAINMLLEAEGAGDLSAQHQ